MTGKTKSALLKGTFSNLGFEAHHAKLDAAIAATRREIELLREYGERLIAYVVTGKVDVRSVKCEVGSVNEETEEEDTEGIEEEATTAEADDEILSEASDAEA